MTVNPQSKSAVLLPLPPSTNHLFATVKGRRVKTRAYREWLAATQLPLLELRRPTSLPVEVWLTVFGKVNARRDLDNLIKPLLDSVVAAGVIPDDTIEHVEGIRIGYGGDWDESEAAVMVMTVPVSSL